MQEKKKIEREREKKTFFVRENYAQNGRDSYKFIVKWYESEKTKIKEDEEKEE